MGLPEKWEDPQNNRKQAAETTSQSVYYGFCSAQPQGAPAWSTVKAEPQGEHAAVGRSMGLGVTPLRLLSH